jgi:hypothetical protein
MIPEMAATLAYIKTHGSFPVGGFCFCLFIKPRSDLTSGSSSSPIPRQPKTLPPSPNQNLSS